MSMTELLAGVRAQNEASVALCSQLERETAPTILSPLIDQLENSLMTLEAAPSPAARAAWSDRVARDTARLVLAMARG